MVFVKAAIYCPALYAVLTNWPALDIIDKVTYGTNPYVIMHK